MTERATALIQDGTLHSATRIENKRYKINDDFKNEWKVVRMLVIDEFFFCEWNTLEHLDEQFRRLKSEPSKAYGGIHKYVLVIFISWFQV